MTVMHLAVFDVRRVGIRLAVGEDGGGGEGGRVVIIIGCFGWEG